jgi:hypothetical protein
VFRGHSTVVMIQRRHSTQDLTMPWTIDLVNHELLPTFGARAAI